MKRTAGWAMACMVLAILGGCSYIRQDPGCRECASADLRPVRPPAASQTTWAQRDAGRPDKPLLVPAGPIDPPTITTIRPTATAATGATPTQSSTAVAPSSSAGAAPNTITPASAETTNSPSPMALPPMPLPAPAQVTPPQLTSLPEKDPAGTPPKPLPPPTTTPVESLTITSAESVPGPSIEATESKNAKPKDLNLGPTETNAVRTLTPYGPSLPKNSAGPVVRLVNKKRITLNYEIKDIGPSGVSGVELWYTRDAKEWKKHEGPPEKKPPYIIEVQEEGLYGFTLLAKNGIGLSKDPPHSGDLPQVWVEVDLTRPAVSLTDVKAGYENKIPALTILWKASDKNLGGQPINLAYSEKEEGPWQPIASSLDNSGRYIWPLRAGLPPRIFVKIEARDLAGNVGVAKTPTPVQVDLSRPVVQVLDVEVSGQ
jgi:hypothetical protein